MYSRFNVIFASSIDGGIGKDGAIPWDIKEEMARFSSVTKGEGNNAVIMGRKTWESIPQNNRPLKNRLNIIISSSTPPPSHDHFFVKSFHEALEFAAWKKVKQVWVIGGAQIYELALKEYLYLCDKIVHTTIQPARLLSTSFDAFVNLEPLKKLKYTEVTKTMDFYIREYKVDERHQEYSYLDLCKNIKENGIIIDHGRTHEKVKRLICPPELNFDLRKGFPLLTTKKMATKNMVRELLWFIKGVPDSKILEDQGCNFWAGNSSKEYLSNMGLNYREGDCGPIYPFQWRHAGAEYKSCLDDYTGQGVDQLEKLIKGLREDPTGRRHILSAWNVADIDKMVLPPCHSFCQFFVEYEKGEPIGLTCKLTQRSADVFLGLPINIASYALLTHMIASLTGYTPYRLVMSLGDAHIYLNHMGSIEKQLSRDPLPFCNLRLARVKDIDSFTPESITFENYLSHGALQGKMAV